MARTSAQSAARPRRTAPFAPLLAAEQRAAADASIEQTTAELFAEHGAQAVDWFDADMDDVITTVHAATGGLLARLGCDCRGLDDAAMFALLQRALGGQLALVSGHESTTRVERIVCFREGEGSPVTCLRSVTLPRYDAAGRLTGSRTWVALTPPPTVELRWSTPADQVAAPTRSSTATQLPDTLCAVPWLNLSLDVDGSVRPCCKFAHQYEAGGADFGNLKQQTLAEVWHSPGMVRLREDFLAGKKPSPCQTCWDEESAGVLSYRQTFEEDRLRDVEIDFDNLHPDRPVTLDLKFSNRCNLKCRICGPLASSLYLSETLRERNDSPVYLEYLDREQDYLQSNKVTRHAQNREILRRWLPQIQHIELFGGETTISEEVQELEELIIAEGCAANIGLLFNTNVTVFSPQAIERWRQFRRVTICLSLDDVERRFEYQRHPAKWEKVKENALKYAALNESTFSVCMFCSVSSYNILYLPEIVAWWRSHCPQIGFVLNYVHYDPPFCVRHLPASVKDAIRAKLLAAAAEVAAWETSLPRRNMEHPPAAAQLREAAAFLDQGTPSDADWQEFLRRTAEYDRIRHEQFAAVFPELWSLIQTSDG